MRLRTGRDQRWADLKAHLLADPATEKLSLWIPDHYLGTAPEQVTAHVEDVRTRIDQTGGSHPLSQQTVVSLNAELDLTPEPSTLPELGLGLIGSPGLTPSNVDGINSTRTGLWVQVPASRGTRPGPGSTTRTP